MFFLPSSFFSRHSVTVACDLVGKKLCFNNIEGEAIGGYLDAYGICSSTGSACSSHTLEPSHVLKAIRLSPIQANSSLRISISKYTTEEDVDYFLEKLIKVIEKLRKISPLVS